MNRFTSGFGQTYFFVLVLVFLAVMILGCRQSTISIVPLGAKFQNADTAFDEAVTMEVRDADPEKMEKNRQKQQGLYGKAIGLYTEVIERDTKGKYAQRAHYQIAKIYKRRYDFEAASEGFKIYKDTIKGIFPEN